MNFHTIDTETNAMATVYDENELAAAVLNSIKYYKEKVEHLERICSLWREKGWENANDELKDQIQALQERLNLSYGEFASQKEKNAYLDFERRHMHERQYLKIQGGKAPYLIPTGTGIGTLLEVVCPICGEKENIKDMEAW